ncbi:MAG TPA: TOPRIM nucleotidyl transferase/hydrolase domain-containing protein [Pseudonocardiaceae bacterium]
MFQLDGVSGLVLVEGMSDAVALETLAVRRGRDLVAEGVSVVSIGGAQAIGKVLGMVRASGREVRLAGLCDAAEETDFRRGLERTGLGCGLTRERMEALGFYVCEQDLEDELIRALGAAAVQDVLARNGKLSSFRTFQKQPQWHGRPVESQLRRFFGSSAGKIRYARPLVEALDLTRVPRPLDRVLAHVQNTPTAPSARPTR